MTDSRDEIRTFVGEFMSKSLLRFEKKPKSMSHILEFSEKQLNSLCDILETAPSQSATEEAKRQLRAVADLISENFPAEVV